MSTDLHGRLGNALGLRLTTTLADRYRIERELGAGGMATVYLAEDLKHHRQVAIKVMHPDLSAALGSERFLAEIATTARLQHPHILPLIDSGDANGLLFYVSPFIDGETLRDRLRREQQLPIDETVRIAGEVLSALGYAHRHGVIHRDIKPENILLLDGSAMVADFGIALAVQQAGGSRMTQTGISLGSPQYMSPEQAMAERSVDGRTDIYSVGVVLYEMLLGEPPFTGPTAQAISAKVMTERPVPLTGRRDTVPEEVDAAVLKALSRYPADRFGTAAELAAALVARPLPSRSAERAAAHRAPKWKPIVPWGAAFACLALALALWRRPVPYAPTIASRIVLDSSQALTGDDQGIFNGVLSRDGSKLVYLGPAKTEAAQLWVQPFDQLHPVPIAGTESPGNFAISPDGGWIAFSQRGQIRKVPLNGRPVVTVTTDSIPANGGVTWLDDNSLLYIAKVVKDGLVLRGVSADGGEPRDVPAHIQGHTQADFWQIQSPPLPNSRGVMLVTCVIAECSRTVQTWILDFSTHQVQLLADAGWAWYLPGGYMAFVTREGGVDAQRFSLRTLKTSGGRVRLFDGVRIDPDGGSAIDISASGTLAYQPAARPLARQELVWVARDGSVFPIDSTWTFPPSPFRSLALSPDGSQLALTLGNEGAEGIWVKQLPRGSLSRLTPAGNPAMRPRWTPDGRFVTFVVYGARGGDTTLRVRKSDGTGSETVLLRHLGGVAEGFLTRDGKWIVARTGMEGVRSRDVVGRRVGSDSLVALVHDSTYDEDSPAVSPNGRWLAYTSNETGKNEVYVRPFPNTGAEKFPISTSGGKYPVWAHSGRELFYLDSARAEMMVVAVTPEAPFRPAEPRGLFRLGKELGHIDNVYTFFDLSPDDQRFIMIRNAAVAEKRPTSIVVIHNWVAEVVAKMKAK